MQQNCGFTGKVACALVTIGALNWGVVGVGMLMEKNWNPVNMLVGSWPTVEAVVYLLVGLSAVYKVVAKMSGACGSSSCSTESCER